MYTPEYSFRPLGSHADYGFGATADAFKEAADDLCAARATAPRLNGHIATSYLYRHAVELYLKSMIVLVHRRLQIPFGSHSAEGDPSMIVEGKAVPFHRIHSVAKSFAYLQQLVNQHAERLGTFCRTDWSALPSQILGWVSLVDDTDPKSTFFRYPNPQSRATDDTKSSFQVGSPEEVIARASLSGKSVKTSVVLDDSDGIVETFYFNADVLPELQAALRSLAEFLEGMHFGMRIELAGGR